MWTRGLEAGACWMRGLEAGAGWTRGLEAGALLARPGKTVVAWPKGEPMVMPTGVEEMVRRLLGLAE